MILVNRGFPKGELSDSLYGRADTVDYALGARILRDFVVGRDGGIRKRPGFKHIDESRFPAKKTRLIRFVFSTATGDTYVVQAGDLYMEFLRDGARITESPKTVTAATQANPCVITSVAHGFANGDDVLLSGFLVGMLELNGRRVRVANKTADTFEITDTSGTNINSLAFGAYSSGGQAARVYKIASPYLEADLQDLRFAQSADVMTITHPDYPPHELSRTAHTSWKLLDRTLPVDPATGDVIPIYAAERIFDYVSGALGAAGAKSFRYRITALTPNGETVPLLEAIRSIANVELLDPARITTTAPHGFTTGDEVALHFIQGTVELNKRLFRITVTAADKFTLDGVDATGYTAYIAAGDAQRTYIRIDAAADPTLALPNVLTILRNSSIGLENDVLFYLIYKQLPSGLYGYIGQVDLRAFVLVYTFRDTGEVAPDPGDNPPEAGPRFDAAGEYPACVAYHQQRLVFARTGDQPDALFLSRLAGYLNFSYHDPLDDRDGIEAGLGSQEINPIMHLVPLRRLVILTGAQEWIAEGNDAGTITPGQLNIRPYTNHGASRVRPAVVESDILYVQARGNEVRNLFWDFANDTYGGQDVTRRASHLFREQSVRDMAFSKTPDGILWVVRNDGTLLSLTYSRAEEILAWCRHETEGQVEQVASIPESDDAVRGGEDAVYIVVVRVVNGRTIRAVERLTERTVDEDLRARYPWFGNEWLIEYHFLDSFRSYNGFNLAATTLTLTGAGWTPAATLTLTASVGTFLAGDVGTGVAARKFHLWDADGNLVALEVVGYTSPTVLSVRSDRNVPVSLQAVARNTWAAAVRRVNGLPQLEAAEISAMGDGRRIANAYLDAAPVVVAGGMATFGVDLFSAMIHVGRPAHADLELLDVENGEGDSIYGRMKTVRNVGAYVRGTRTFWAGRELPEDDGTPGALVSGMDELQADDAAEVVSGDLPAPLLGGHFDIQIEGEPTEHGRASIRCVEPTPLEISAVSRSVELEG